MEHRVCVSNIQVVLTLTLLIVETETKDLRMGRITPQSRMILDETRAKKPSMFVRADDVLVDAPMKMIISAIDITDLDEMKDGVVEIENGDIGKKRVLIGLRGPSLLKGYRFKVVVYAEAEKAIRRLPYPHIRNYMAKKGEYAKK